MVVQTISKVEQSLALLKRNLDNKIKQIRNITVHVWPYIKRYKMDLSLLHLRIIRLLNIL
jgi:hypothetical protein